MLPRPRVVAIEHDLIALDLHDVEHLVTAIRCAAAQLTAHFHAGRKFAFGNGLHQALITLAKRIGRRQFQSGCEADFLAFQCRFDFGKRVVIATVQIRGGFLRFVQQLALRIRHFVEHGDDGVLGDFHGGGPVFQIKNCR